MKKKYTADMEICNKKKKDEGDTLAGKDEFDYLPAVTLTASQPLPGQSMGCCTPQQRLHAKQGKSLKWTGNFWELVI